MEEHARLTRAQYEGIYRFREPLELESGVFGEGESAFTWEQAVRTVRNQKWFLAMVAVALSLASVAGALALKDVYQSSATLEVDPQGGGIRTLNEIENPRSDVDADYLETQAQILRSNGLAMRVIRGLRLAQNAEFVSKKDAEEASAPPAQATAGVAGSADESAFLREQQDLADPTDSEAVALRAFQTKLSVNPIRSSRLIEVSFASHDPRLAQAVTNTLVTQFIDQNYKNRFVTTMEASEWLSTQLNDLRRKVTESNQAVADYQRKYGLVDSDERDMPLAQLMTEQSHQLSLSQADRIQSEAYVRMIEAGQPDDIPAVRDDIVYQNLLTHYADVRGQVAQAKTIYGDESANVRKLEGESKELAAQVDAERTRLISRVRAAYDAARARETMSQLATEKLRAQMGDASSHLVEYRTLKNEATANAELYNTLQARLKEAGIYAGLRSGNIRVVDLAPRLRQPTSPHRKLIITAGVMLSCLFAVVLAFVRETLDNTVRIPDDIRSWVGLPSLAVFPAVSRKGAAGQAAVPSLSGAGVRKEATSGLPKLFWSQSETAEGEAIRGLRTSLLFGAPGMARRVVLVTSASAGEGKTTVAVNLAGVLAQQGKVCLVEGDFRRPMIERTLGMNGTAGLAEVLHGTLAVEEALVPVAGIPGLSVLPAGALPKSPGDLIASEGMRATLIALREQFDYIVIDSPPVIPFSDAQSLASLVDAVILVGRYGRTTRRGITRGAQILADVQAPVAGVVLNDMDLTSADYHYFNYGYSRGNNDGGYDVAKRAS